MPWLYYVCINFFKNVEYTFKLLSCLEIVLMNLPMIIVFGCGALLEVFSVSAEYL